MLNEFEKKVAEFIREQRIFASADKVLLAVSGGADSTALMYAMCALKAENILRMDFICAHINHQLRGAEADLDEDFVVAEVEKLNLRIITKQLDVIGFAHFNKLSIETAARKLRIESLLDIAKANNCNWIATGHQKNDNAETIVQRLGRGTGLRGLAGIWPMRVFNGDIRFARPLLCVRRDEIIEYLRKQNLKWRQDRTNADCSYRRNFIRHRLLPALQKRSDSCIVEQLFDLSRSAQRFYHLVYSEVARLWPELVNFSGNKVILNLRSFLCQAQPLRAELIRRSLTTIGAGERELTQRHYERILQLAEQRGSGRRIDLPGGFVVRREYEDLIFAQPPESSAADERVIKSVELKDPGKIQFGQYLIEATILEAEPGRLEQFKAEKTNFIEWFDLGRVKLPVVIRFRQNGDRFWPLGLAAEKRVGKFLTGEKVPQEIRRRLLIIADSEKIIWVWPIRISEQAKITSETRKILQLQIKELVFSH